MPISSVPPDLEKNISVRVLWPFARLVGPNPAVAEIFAREGISLADFVRPDTRFSQRVVVDMLEAVLRAHGDPALGLKAGEESLDGELDTLEFAARSCATLREALRCASRYVHLMNETVEASLTPDPAGGLWRVRVRDGFPSAPALNDFILSYGAHFARRYTGVVRPALEVHVAHDEPAYKDEYTRIFQTEIRFGMPHNGFLLSNEHLELPMLHAHMGFQRAFEMTARELSDRGGSGFRARVRALVTVHLRAGDMCMDSVARELAVSVATLRRRLHEEDTTFSDVVDEVRRELAHGYLGQPNLSIGEIAFLLGFSHAPAFHKAFKRWNGMSPSQHRNLRALARDHA